MRAVRKGSSHPPMLYNVRSCTQTSGIQIRPARAGKFKACVGAKFSYGFARVSVTSRRGREKRARC